MDKVLNITGFATVFGWIISIEGLLKCTIIYAGFGALIFLFGRYIGTIGKIPRYFR